jgi:hypothetical protein
MKSNHLEGNLERVITSLVNTDYSKKEADLDLISTSETYSCLIKDKLPKIINRINLLGEYIFPLNELYWRDNGSIYKVSKLLRGDFFLVITPTCVEGYATKFIFDKDSKLIKRLKLFTLSNTNLNKLAYFKRKNEEGNCLWRKLIDEKTISAFSEEFIKRLTRDNNFYFSHIPISLNKFPNILTKIYKGKKLSKKKKIQIIKEDISNLNQLDISDF